MSRASGNRETDAEPALAAVQSALALRKQIEDLRQEFGCDADAGVRHREHQDAAVLDPRAQSQFTSGLGVLRGIVEQIGEYLGKAYQVRLELHRAVQHVGDQVMMAFFDPWAD